VEAEAKCHVPQIEKLFKSTAIGVKALDDLTTVKINFN
jgi:hypothetical protein